MQLYKYAMGNDYKSSCKPFSLDEMCGLWNNTHRLDYIGPILIRNYTGLHSREFGEVKIKTSVLKKDISAGVLKKKLEQLE